jgi:tryptophan synthase alpha chain
VADFFGDAGLAVFLNAGDPPLDTLTDVALLLDAWGVDCLELAVPFPDSPSDGPVIRRSALRALDRGVDLATTLTFVRSIRPRLTHLTVVLLADWAWTVRALGLPDFLGRVTDSGSDALLVHGVPPKARPGYYQAAHKAGLPIVTTCYPSSAAAVQAEAAANASAYLYLVAAFGRTGAAPRSGYHALAPMIAALRAMTSVPIAVGFGIQSAADIRAVRQVGADAAVVGSACVARIERALNEGRDVVADIRGLLPQLISRRTTLTAGRTM